MLQPGEIINERYMLEDLLAEGGMGQVWKARDQRLDRLVALKILKFEYADNQLFLDRFRDEAKNTAKLNHEHIARIFDYGETALADSGEKIVFLAIEYIPGQSLSELLADQAPLSVNQTLDILEQAAAGLAAAHAQGLIHRDIKPGNIMINQGKVQITDFGISKAKNQNAFTHQDTVLGTANYVSPEQAKGEEITPASDIYSLAVVGYEALVGEPPFKGDSPVATALQHVKEAVPELSDKFPAPVRELLAKALDKDPQKRFQTGQEFEQAIKETRSKLVNPTTVMAKVKDTEDSPADSNKVLGFWRNLTAGWTQLQRNLLGFSIAMLFLGVLLTGFFLAISHQSAPKNNSHKGENAVIPTITVSSIPAPASSSSTPSSTPTPVESSSPVVTPSSPTPEAPSPSSSIPAPTTPTTETEAPVSETTSSPSTETEEEEEDTEDEGWNPFAGWGDLGDDDEDNNFYDN